MSEHEHEDDHSESCRKNRVAKQGLILSEVALSMASGIRCVGADSTPEQMEEALDYVVDACVHIAMRSDDPRLVIERIVTKLEGYPIEELQQLLAQHTGRNHR